MSKKNITSSTIYTCSGCPNYKSKIIVFGPKPVYSHICNHSEIKDGRLNRLESGIPIVPKWCPLKKHINEKSR